MRTFSRIFDSFFRNKVNPDSKPLHVFYGENQNSKQPETEPKNNCESHEVVSISDEQENQTKTLKMTDAFKAEAWSLWPAAAANITNHQVARFFDDHSNFFESTLCELFLNAYRHGNFKNLSIDTNEPDPHTSVGMLCVKADPRTQQVCSCPTKNTSSNTVKKYNYLELYQWFFDRKNEFIAKYCPEIWDSKCSRYENNEKLFSTYLVLLIF